MSDKTSQATVRGLLEKIKQINASEAQLLLCSVLQRDRVWLVTHGGDGVMPEQAEQFAALVACRAAHEPIAYLLGEREFFGRKFFVNKNVLIPRPETELLIQRAMMLATDRHPAIWDVGTGSGAIAVTLAAEIPGSSVLATDISTHALITAQTNSERYEQQRHVTFLKSNLLQPTAYQWLKRESKNRQLIIAANLPYLPVSDKKKLAKDVVAYEPSRALFSGTDGLTLINRFLRQLARHLPDWHPSQMSILLEFDPPQTNALKKIAEDLFPRAHIIIHRDLARRNRLMEIAM